MRTLPCLALALVLAAAADPAMAQDAPAGPDAFVVNRAENPNYETDIRAWQLGSLPGVGTASWDPSDANGSSASGSARVTNNYSGTAAFSEVRFSQCVGGVVPGQTYQATARAFVPPGQPGLSRVLVDIRFFNARNCAGLSTGGGFGPLVGPDGTDGWILLQTDEIAPSPPPFAALSARVSVILHKNGNQGDDAFQAFFDDVTISGASRFVKGDMNGDGETDILVHNNVTGQTDVWTMSNTVRDGAPLSITPAAASLDWVVAGVDDFNADLQNDLLMWNHVTGETEFWLMNGTTRVGPPVPLAGALPPPWKPSATADFSSDGRPDIVYRNFSTQKIVVWIMVGTIKVLERVPVPDQAVDGNWEIVAALDFNDDLLTDFLWYNSTSGKIVLWFMNGNLTRISGQFTNPPNAGDNNWKVLAAGDYGIGLNGICCTNDIVWRNETSGRYVVWQMDYAGNRTFGGFTTPMSPSPNPTDWTIAGPR